MNKTVLIVDDSDFVVQMIRFTLEQEGYTTLAGIDGKDALKHFDGQHIDLVITDLNMPNMDGLDLINSIRLQAAYHHIPIVLFDSHNTNDADYLKRSGATALLSKDLVSEQLVSTVKQMIG
ncbi:response regulator [Niastella caeni]|uniref:Response regulator n=1 Tax=Niastella caeni TaxID=2569763 RepID=A0A4S8I2E5_9BACT|nr:response regulator [Niastella caeni]THU40804.1 response regulator [Niastella caeni]